MGSVQSSGSINSSSSSKNGVNFKNFNTSGLEVKIEELTEEEGKDTLANVLRLRVPFFDNNFFQALSNITYITGNGPFHEGLIFHTSKGLYYIAQTYPVTFISVDNLDKAVKEILSFCQFNQHSHEFKVTNEYHPTKNVTVSDIVAMVRTMPNEYNILGENCQKFCQKIVNGLELKQVN